MSSVEKKTAAPPAAAWFYSPLLTNAVRSRLSNNLQTSHHVLDAELLFLQSTLEGVRSSVVRARVHEYQPPLIRLQEAASKPWEHQRVSRSHENGESQRESEREEGKKEREKADESTQAYRSAMVPCWASSFQKSCAMYDSSSKNRTHE